MAHFSVGHVQAHHLCGVEGFLVELDGFGGLFDAQVRRDAVEALGNRFDAHIVLLEWWLWRDGLFTIGHVWRGLRAADEVFARQQ